MKKISILIPTRGNDAELSRTLFNCVEQAAHPERLEFVIRADDDLSVQQLPQLPGGAKTIHLIGPRLGYARIHDYYEECYQSSTGDLLFAYNDDVAILTKDWDVAFEKAMYSPAAEVASCDVAEGERGYRWAFPMIRRSLCQRIGNRFCAGTETCDRIFDAYARISGRGVHVLVHLLHKQAPLVPGTERESFYNYATSHWREMNERWDSAARKMLPGATLEKEERPRIHVVASFYNEELLVPFFLSHYAFADQIHALITPSPDSTVELLRAAPNVTETFYDMPDGMDDGRKIDMVNRAVSELGRVNACDWIIVVDSDEFVWPERRPHNADCHDWLSSIDPSITVVEAAMWQVFQHESEGPLDIHNEPVIFQRRHGSPDRSAPGCIGYCKPIIIRAGRGLQFEPGQHRLRPNPKIKMGDRRFDGAHWALADAGLVARRIRDRRDRLSANNKKAGWGSHVSTATEDSLLSVCRDHLSDPQVF